MGRRGAGKWGEVVEARAIVGRRRPSRAGEGWGRRWVLRRGVGRGQGPIEEEGERFERLGLVELVVADAVGSTELAAAGRWEEDLEDLAAAAADEQDPESHSASPAERLVAEIPAVPAVLAERNIAAAEHSTAVSQRDTQPTERRTLSSALESTPPSPPHPPGSAAAASNTAVAAAVVGVVRLEHIVVAGEEQRRRVESSAALTPRSSSRKSSWPS